MPAGIPVKGGPMRNPKKPMLLTEASANSFMVMYLNILCIELIWCERII